MIERLARIACARMSPRPVRSAVRVHAELLVRAGWPVVTGVPDARRVLVVAPHMDDETFGCGGTLARCVAGGADVVAAFLTDGAKGRATADTRKDEARKAATILGLAEPIFLDFPDGGLDATPETVARLADVVRAVKPDVVFLPFLTDPHPDHWMANVLWVAAAEAARVPPTVACWAYEIWAPLPPNRVVDITAVIDDKRAAIDVFHSQIAEYDYPRAVLGLNSYRSLLTGRGKGFAEAFYVADVDVYRGLFEAVVVRRDRQNRQSRGNA